MRQAMQVVHAVSGLPVGTGTFLDVGANNGITTIRMLLAGEAERAVSIEPEPQNFARLQHNVRQNGLEDRVHSLQLAVSDKTATMEFELSSTNYGDHRVRPPSNTPKLEVDERFHESERRVISVQTRLLDDVLSDVPEPFQENPLVLWIDVQGHEGYVFRGAQNLLKSGVPVVSEIWPYGIKRAGMTHEAFFDITRTFWSSFWVRRSGRFIEYPINVLYTSSK